MKAEERTREFLQHAVAACDRVAEYLAGIDRGRFLAARLLQDAVVRNMEVIGEALTKLRDHDPVILGRYPDVPWREAISFRNRMIHGYSDIDYEIVWEATQAELPSLRRQLTAIIEAERS